MKKNVPILLLVVLIACRKHRTGPVLETAVTKKIEYHIFAGKDYSDGIYANVKVDVRLQIQKVNYRTGETNLLWDTVFATKNISDYPQYINKIVINKFYPVLESKEKLTGGFAIKYNDGRYISQEAESDDVVPGEMWTLLEADL